MTILYMSVPLVKKGVNLLTNNKRVYTVEEIQAILGVSKNTTYALVKSGVPFCESWRTVQNIQKEF